jgi:mobilome CxxCx(11)CxxC protein
MLVGLLVLSYGHFKSLPTVIAVVSAFAIVQTVISLWSIIGGWVAGYSYATASAADNSRLAARYEDLASGPPDDPLAFRHDYEKLVIRDEGRQEQDYQQGVKESEKRMGLRAALRKYGRKCAGCEQVPTSMKSTDCGVCGNFRYHVN